MKLWMKKILQMAIGSLVGGLILGLGGILILVTSYHSRIYPGIRVGPVMVGGLGQTQANQLLTEQITNYRKRWPIIFSDGLNLYSIGLDNEAINYDTGTSVDEAYRYGRSISIRGLSELVSLINKPPQVALTVKIKDEWLDSVSASMAAVIDVPKVPPTIEVVKGDQGAPTVKIILGQPGQSLNQMGWKNMLKNSIANLTMPETRLPIIKNEIEVSLDQLKKTEDKANKLLTKSLKLTYNPSDNLEPNDVWELSGTDLIKFIRFDGSFDKDLIDEYLIGVAEAVNQPAQNAKFKFDEQSAKVTEFVPAENGIILNIPQSNTLIYQALTNLSNDQLVDSIKLAYESVAPTVTLDEVNRMGIKEKIGVGTSTYFGSIPTRVHNVALAAARLNGTLIKPGEEFSFNQSVGEISAATGYQAAYIIQNGRTELGDGGGVCQDSTTVFRAALSAGLPITVRRGHAYRVGYYEQDQKPGLDATVYSPSTDFKFMNDTPGHILIQAEADSENRKLTVTFFGTSDGRKSEILDHVIWDVTPPPPDVYVDDPTLAPGQLKQIDWKAPGTKAKFTYRVTRNGEILQDKVFYTTYKPWAAVYLRGPQP